MCNGGGDRGGHQRVDCAKQNLVTSHFCPLVFWCYSCGHVVLHSKGDFADVIMVANQLTLKQEDFSGLSNRPHVIT